MGSPYTYDMGQFFHFLRHHDDIYISARIHAQLVGSRVDVAMLRDQMVESFLKKLHGAPIHMNKQPFSSIFCSELM